VGSRRGTAVFSVFPGVPVESTSSFELGKKVSLELIARKNCKHILQNSYIILQY